MAHRLGKRIAAPVGTQAFGRLSSAGKDHPVRREPLTIGTNDKSFGGKFQSLYAHPGIYLHLLPAQFHFQQFQNGGRLIRAGIDIAAPAFGEKSQGSKEFQGLPIPELLQDIPGKFRIFAMVAGSIHRLVGQVAASISGGKYFLSDVLFLFQNKDLGIAVASGRSNRSHNAGGPSSDDSNPFHICSLLLLFYGSVTIPSLTRYSRDIRMPSLA